MNTRIIITLWIGSLLVLLLSLSGCPGFSGSLVGIVLDATTGNPVCGAIVELRSDNRFEQAVTDSNGVFAFLSLADEEHAVQVISADGYAASEVTRVPAPGEATDESELPIVEIQLSPGNSGVGEPCGDSRNVAGTVLDAESEAPVCGALVMLSDPATGTILGRTFAQRDGLFIFPAVEPGEYELIVLGAEGFSATEPQPITVVPVSENDSEFEQLPVFALNSGEFNPPDADDLNISGDSIEMYNQFIADYDSISAFLCAPPGQDPPRRTLGCGLQSGAQADTSPQPLLLDAEEQRDLHNAYARYRTDFLIVMVAALMMLFWFHGRLPARAADADPNHPRKTH